MKKRRALLLRAMFEVTYRCNFKCRHCYIPPSYKKNTEELKKDRIFLILDQLKEMGCFYLGFTGGEPFMRDDMMDIIRYAVQSGFEVMINTNGSLLNKDIVNELARLRLNKIDITIPAITESAFERISGVKGSRKRVFNAIDLLHEKKVGLGFKTCVLKENEREIGAIRDFARSLGARHRLDDMLSPCLDGSIEPYRYRGRTSVKKSRIHHKIRNTKDKLISEPLFKCGVGSTQAAITPSGELKACLMLDSPRYSMVKTSSRSAWSRMARFVRGVRPDESYDCGKCELKPYCKWCPVRGWLHCKSFTSCDPECRSFAEAVYAG